MKKCILVISMSILISGCGSAAAPVAPVNGQPPVMGVAAPARCSTRFLPLPDPACTPGAVNPAVRQDTIHQTICVPGWTTTVRPPVGYTNAQKNQGITAYGYADKNPASYEEDHFLPLEVGGSPTDPKNLWPEPHTSSSGKDTVENAVKTAVCAGKVSLTDAQHALLTNWTTARMALGGI